MYPSIYRVILRNRDGHTLADLTGRARDRRISRARNEADDIQWALDLAEYERFCRKINVHPLSLLVPFQTEVVIKRLGVTVAAGYLVWRQPDLSTSGDIMSIRATGFLNLLKKRRTEDPQIFENMNRADIAWQLINYSQSKGPYWDFGITKGTIVTVGAPYSRQFQREIIKGCLTELATVDDAPYDHAITPDKVFNTYAPLGERRQNAIFEYPGNITRLQAPFDGSDIVNQLYGYGSGSGTQAGLGAIKDDPNSQSQYYVQEDKFQDSGNIDVDSLGKKTQSEVTDKSQPFEIPIFEVNPSRGSLLLGQDYDIGDYVRVKTRSYKSVEHLNNFFRFERYDLTVDDKDNEKLKPYMSI